MSDLFRRVSTFQIDKDMRAHRLASGAVELEVEGRGVHMFSDSTWASLVAAMSLQGGNADSYGRALKLHNEPGPPIVIMETTT